MYKSFKQTLFGFGLFFFQKFFKNKFLILFFLKLKIVKKKFPCDSAHPIKLMNSLNDKGRVSIFLERKSSISSKVMFK